MARLPIPGNDSGTWGTVLNEFLEVEHNSNGTLKASGTLATKANDADVVHLAGTETISGAKTFSSAPTVPTPSASGHATTKAYVDAIQYVRHVAPVFVTSGTLGGDTPPNTSGAWQQLSAVGEIAIPAAVGDFIMVQAAFLTLPDANTTYDLAIKTGGILMYFASSGSGTPGIAGDPGMYPETAFRPNNGGWLAATVTSGMIDVDNQVHVVLAVNSAGGGKTYYSTNYPFRWFATSHLA